MAGWTRQAASTRQEKRERDRGKENAEANKSEKKGSFAGGAVSSDDSDSSSDGDGEGREHPAQSGAAAGKQGTNPPRLTAEDFGFGMGSGTDATFGSGSQDGYYFYSTGASV